MYKSEVEKLAQEAVFEKLAISEGKVQEVLQRAIANGMSKERAQKLLRNRGESVDRLVQSAGQNSQHNRLMDLNLAIRKALVEAYAKKPAGGVPTSALKIPTPTPPSPGIPSGSFPVGKALLGAGIAADLAGLAYGSHRLAHPEAQNKTAFEKQAISQAFVQRAMNNATTQGVDLF